MQTGAHSKISLLIIYSRPEIRFSKLIMTITRKEFQVGSEEKNDIVCPGQHIGYKGWDNQILRMPCPWRVGWIICLLLGAVRASFSIKQHGSSLFCKLNSSHIRTYILISCSLCFFFVLVLGHNVAVSCLKPDAKDCPGQFQELWNVEYVNC